MRFMITARNVFASLALLMLALACSGCYEELDSSPQAQSPPAAGGDATAHPMDAHLSQGGGSALGGAKRSAQSTADKVDDYNKQISDAADDALGDD